MSLAQAITLILTILHLNPHSPREACIVRYQNEIGALAVQASERYNVPVPIILVVGFNETHMGCDPNEGGDPAHGVGWGAPIDGRHRHTPGTIFTQAHILSVGYQACGTWVGSITRFRSGSCTLPSTDDRLIYVRRVQRMIPHALDYSHIPMDFSLTAHRPIVTPAIMLTTPPPVSQ